MIGRLDTAIADTIGAPYEPERVVLYAQAAAGFDQELVRNGGPWPFAFSPDEMTGDSAGFACRTLQGEAANEVMTVLRGADSLTLWDFDGTDLRLLARPLLPHQQGC